MNVKPFIDFWQHIPQHVSPTIIEIGSFQLRYYSLMYLIAFFLTYVLVIHRIKFEDEYEYTHETIQNYLIWTLTGLIIGARLGFVVIYDFEYYLRHPLSVIIPFDLSQGFQYVGISGMSYHGGVIGIIIASVIFCRKYSIQFWKFADLFSPAIPLGYTFGRIGNFINGELYGRVTDRLWGMYFPLDPFHQLRHPSQLYEAFFEGIILFVVLWSLRKKRYFDGYLFSLYLIGYGLVRFIIEFFRQPDPQLGFVMGILTMGQLLCLIMLFLGMFLIITRKRQFHQH